MTKQHFIKLAVLLASQRPSTIENSQWEAIREGIADICIETNPFFDYDRFIEATEK